MNRKILGVAGNDQSDLWHYASLRIPQLVARFLPYSVLLATIITLATLNQNSEVVAMKAAGISAHQMLAPLIVAEIWRVIGQIRATGISTLIVDRDYRRVLAHTDRAAVMEKGRIVLAGASDTLASDPAALAQYLGV